MRVSDSSLIREEPVLFRWNISQSVDSHIDIPFESIPGLRDQDVTGHSFDSKEWTKKSLDYEWRLMSKAEKEVYRKAVENSHVSGIRQDDKEARACYGIKAVRLYRRRKAWKPCLTSILTKRKERDESKGII